MLIYLAAILNGFGASILWLSQGKYITKCATDSNKGLFNGTFWAIFMSSNIIGYLMSAFVIGAVSELSTFFVIMTSICICSSLFFLLLSPPTPHPEEEAQKAESPEENQKPPTVAETWAQLTEKRMLPMLLVFVTQGWSVALFGTIFIPLMSFKMTGLGYTDTEEEKRALLAMIGFGCSEILGSIIVGKVQDKYGLFITGRYILATSALAFFCLFFFTSFEYFAMWRAVLMTFTWGLYDSGLMNFAQCICGFQFKSKGTAFQVFYVMQASTVFVSLMVASQVTTTLAYFIYFAFGAVLVVFAWTIFMMKFEPIKKDQSLDEKEARLNATTKEPSQTE